MSFSLDVIISNLRFIFGGYSIQEKPCSESPRQWYAEGKSLIKAEKQSEGFTDPVSDINVTCFANSRAFPSATVAESQYWQSLSFRSKGNFERKNEFPIETIQTIVGIFRHLISIDGMTICCRFPRRIEILEFIQHTVFLVEWIK